MSVRLLRTLSLAVAALVAAFVAVVWFWVLHSGGVLTRPLPEYRTVGVERTLAEYADGDREHVAVELEGPGGEPMKFTVSLPVGTHDAGSDAERLPVVLLLTGFATAHRNLTRFPEHGRNAIVSLDYPYERARWKASGIIARVGIAWDVAYGLPNGVAAALEWIRGHDWAGSPSLVGVSLGAVCLPAIQRRLSTLGVRPDATVLAYGAVDVASLVETNVPLGPSIIGGLAASFAGALVSPLEPARHLPELQGRFLLVNGEHDDRFPPEAVERLHALTPEPKEIVILDGDHVDGRRPETIARLGAIVREWLTRQGALND